MSKCSYTPSNVRRRSTLMKHFEAFLQKTTAELDALLPSILDKAFKGNL